MRTMYVMVVLGVVGCTKPATAPPPSDRATPNGPVTSEEVKQEFQEAGKTASQYLDQKQEEFRREFQERLSRLDEDIERLKQKAADAKADAKPRWEAAQRELEAKRARAQAKLDELKSEAPGAWEEFKQGAENAWTELREGYNKASQELDDSKTDVP